MIVQIEKSYCLCKQETQGSQGSSSSLSPKAWELGEPVV